MPFFKLASDLGTMFPDESIITSTSGKDVLDFFVVKTREQDSASVEAFLETVQRVYVDFRSNTKSLSILVYFFDMCNC